MQATPAQNGPAAAARPLVDGDRMLNLLREVSGFGAHPGGGVTRTGLSPEDTAARDHLARRCRAGGLRTSTDQAGNLIVRRANADPAAPVVLMGSHLDTVARGGRFDGAYGVIAACEVVRTLAHADRRPAWEPVAIAFTNEEGAHYAYPFLGSLALTGGVDVDRADSLVDPAGTPLRAALRRAGGDLDTINDAAWPPGSIGCYLELHIEQGPLLEARGIPVGLVETITGRTVLDITVTGTQGHAGTTPMELRRDALTVAAHVVLVVQRLAGQQDRCAVATVGVLNPRPNVTNVIAGRVRLTAELRDGDRQRLQSAEDGLRIELARLAKATDTGIEVRSHRVAEPTATSELARNAIRCATDDLGLPHLALDSGAGHDAQIVAGIAPIGMIFVPSHDGVSHAPEEHTDDHDLVAGAETLLNTVLHLPTGPTSHR
ncbi:Zn-dependent hydrolase [Amycolatopsis sp. NPDC049252]|uniref:Zn-dependent hydrolase n=1 Tax=Amycolatopsis sp. NPDC049252 TaxID=3363933 RepID=UPI00371450DD